MYLNCHSYYSLRFGTMSVETLVDEAVTAYSNEAGGVSSEPAGRTASGLAATVVRDIAPAMAPGCDATSCARASSQSLPSLAWQATEANRIGAKKAVAVIRLRVRFPSMLDIVPVGSLSGAE